MDKVIAWIIIAIIIFISVYLGISFIAWDFKELSWKAIRVLAFLSAASAAFIVFNSND